MYKCGAGIVSKGSWHGTVYAGEWATRRWGSFRTSSFSFITIRRLVTPFNASTPQRFEKCQGTLLLRFSAQFQLKR